MLCSTTRWVRIARKKPETAEICSFELVDPDGQPLPPFTAGAHIDVQLPGGPLRQYSLCSPPWDTQLYLIAVLREPASRGGSRGMHALAEGQLVLISEPRNCFELDASAGHHLLVGGGIGITPLLAMAETLARDQASFELHYCTRASERTAFVDRIVAGPIGPHAEFHHDDGPTEQRFDPRAVLDQAHAGTHLYVCGPAGFMDWVLGSARAAGWPESRLHREYFAAPVRSPCTEGEFEVQIASTGAVIQVSAGQSILAALAQHGFILPTSCEQGICGTCAVGVLDGVPDHRDMCLTQEERMRGDRLTPCCSRSLSPRLVLDI
ncbi:PDR/VanB family oxidoreductase [Ramlibacter tataouinensis]|uniref:PDR/VanB family oxidoreductase n=1 Tax=Ramlibacter tataouinensis TaxID=94132 RepID=UPI0022F3D322|nr:PDR/VanB family oxidoreductase [Ramlibacter tataouinensis]WBY02375.1 PDR/VanB family oxidoreductase [Ramlibacter tataouinensis]